MNGRGGRTRYVVIMVAGDGTMSCCGAFLDAFKAERLADRIADKVTGLECTVVRLEQPSAVLRVLNGAQS